MENSQNTKNDQEARQGGFTSFFTQRVILMIVLAVGILWMISLLLGSLDQPPLQMASAPEYQTTAHTRPAPSKTEHLQALPQPPEIHATGRTEHPPEASVHVAAPTHAPQQPVPPAATHQAAPAAHQAGSSVLMTATPAYPTAAPAHEIPAPAHTTAASVHATTTPGHSAEVPAHATAAPAHATTTPGHSTEAPAHATAAPAHTTAASVHATTAPAHATATPAHATATPAAPDSHQPAPAHPETGAQSIAPADSAESATAAHVPPESADAHGAHGAPIKTFPAPGMALIDAIIQPMDNELHHRFWGWRPNDILDFTDNVNNFQLGVLEVTRRSAVILAERISRTGSTASFDPNLQTAMNWFMVKADRYWFPSPESKYSAGLAELREYFHRLEKGEADFYSRSDNLIPLLMAFEDLLGSCDENLVKLVEDDGSPVSHFKADNYFYYAKGVASSMVTILEAVMIDFSTVIDTREGTEVLHHGIESLHHAVEIDPWLITNSDLSGILANHRANMAAPISHARFYLGVLIKALST